MSADYAHVLLQPECTVDHWYVPQDVDASNLLVASHRTCRTDYFIELGNGDDERDGPLFEATIENKDSELGYDKGYDTSVFKFQRDETESSSE